MSFNLYQQYIAVFSGTRDLPLTWLKARPGQSGANQFIHVKMCVWNVCELICYYYRKVGHSLDFLSIVNILDTIYIYIYICVCVCGFCPKQQHLCINTSKILSPCVAFFRMLTTSQSVVCVSWTGTICACTCICLHVVCCCSQCTQPHMRGSVLVGGSTEQLREHSCWH